MLICVSDIKEQLFYCKTGNIWSFSNHILPHEGMMHCKHLDLHSIGTLFEKWWTCLQKQCIYTSSRSGTTLAFIWKSFWPPDNIKFFTLFCLYRVLWEIRAELGYNSIWACQSVWFHSHLILYTHSIFFLLFNYCGPVHSIHPFIILNIKFTAAGERKKQSKILSVNNSDFTITMSGADQTVLFKPRKIEWDVWVVSFYWKVFIHISGWLHSNLF